MPQSFVDEPRTPARHGEVVHERDALLARVETLQRQLDDITAKHRHWVAVVCDRCKRSLALSSPMQLSSDCTGELVEICMYQGWRIGPATLKQDQSDTSSGDLCPSCRAIVEVTP